LHNVSNGTEFSKKSGSEIKDLHTQKKSKPSKAGEGPKMHKLVTKRFPSISEHHLPLTVFQWILLLPILHARQHQRGLCRTPNSQPAVPCHQVKWCQTWTNSMWPNEKNVTTCDKPLWNVAQNLKDMSLLLQHLEQRRDMIKT
jgi:hypothetical protein